MKRFRFRFEAVERLRKARESEALSVFGRAQKAYQEALSARRAQEKLLADSLERREALGAEPVPGTAFQLETEFIDGTKRRIAWAAQAVERARKHMEKTLRAFIDARKRLRVIEALRNRDYEGYRRERAKAESRALDELYVTRAGSGADPFGEAAS